MSKLAAGICRWTKFLLLLLAGLESYCVDSFSLRKSSRLSHVMLKVPSVDATAKYWTDKGGSIKISKTKGDGKNDANGSSSELMSAFIELGYPQALQQSKKNDDGDSNNTDASPCFALELVATDKTPYDLGNSISYIGVSMLLQFQNDLLGVIKGDSKPESQGSEPNGIEVSSSASAPGDLIARIALKSNDLLATNEFYTTILGMENKAQDEQMLCLRYESSGGSKGVPTTLVFDATTDKIDIGDCFDHLVIATKSNIDDVFDELKSGDGDTKMFMNPTDMFGKKVMGVFDPNGYKIVICSM